MDLRTLIDWRPSLWGIIVVITTGIILFVIFYLADKIRLFNQILGKKYQMYRLRLTEFKILIFTIYFLWSIKIIFPDTLLFEIIFFIGLIAFSLWFSYFIIKELMAGFLFRWSNYKHLNKLVSFNSVSGQLSSFGITNFKLKSVSDELIQVPYSKAVNEILILSESPEEKRDWNFILHISKNKDWQEIYEDLFLKLIKDPLVNSTKPINIKLIEQTEDIYKVNIKLTLNSPDFKDEFYSRLKLKFEGR